MLISDDTRFLIPDHVLSRKAAGETVVLNLDNEEYYSLDDVGARAWELMETGITFAEAIATLLDEYEVEGDLLRADLTALVGDLVESGLVLVDAP